METLGEAHTRARGDGDQVGGEDLAELRGDRGDLFGLETGANAMARREGPGRPPGAQNKRTSKLAAYLAATVPDFKHPAQLLAAIWSEDTVKLARRLGCKRIEALELQRKAATDGLPYFEQKLPTAVELPANPGVPVLILGAMDERIDPATGEAMSLDDVLDAEFEEIEQDQGLSGGASVRPADGGSHDES